MLWLRLEALFSFWEVGNALMTLKYGSPVLIFNLGLEQP